MKFISRILLLLLASACIGEAFPYDTNSAQAPVVDDNGFFMFPSTPIASGITFSNYGGGAVSITVGTNQTFRMTNYFSHAGFGLSTNGHFTAWDEYGTVLKFGTNGLLSITQTGGNTFAVSNGAVIAMSGGLNLLWMNVTNPATGQFVFITNGNMTVSNSVFIGGTASAQQFIAGAFSQNPMPLTLLGSGDYYLGGITNVINDTGTFGGASGIVGGGGNSITDGGNNLIGGGFANAVNFGFWNFIGGGDSNSVSKDRNAIIGGTRNSIFGASNNIILGGYGNIITGNSYGNTVLGGTLNTINAGSNSVAGGFNLTISHNNCFVFSDTNVATTGPGEVIFMVHGGVCIGTNSPGTNQMYVAGTLAADNLVVNGTNFSTQLSVLSAAVYYWLSFGSNYLQGQIDGNQNFAVGASNNAVSYSISMTNDVMALSNHLVSAIDNTAQKAFTASLPATFASIGIGFNTPLMPDGNFSVSLTPQDQTTADAIVGGLMYVWVDSKNTSGFTLHADFATNAFSLNFDCIVHENSQ